MNHLGAYAKGYVSAPAFLAAQQLAQELQTLWLYYLGVNLPTDIFQIQVNLLTAAIIVPIVVITPNVPKEGE